MTLSIEETPFLELIPLNPHNPISIKTSIRPNDSDIVDIVAFWTKALKLTESELQGNYQFFTFFRGLREINGD